MIKNFVKILTFLILMCQIQAYSRKFLKIENCTTSGRSAIIDECSIKNNKINFVFRIVNETISTVVSLWKG